MGLSVGGNWWDQLGTSIGDSMIGMADPFGSLNPADPMARQNAIRSSVGAMGAGMLANSRKRPMEAFGAAYQSAQQQGQQNSMNALQAQNLMLGMENQRKDMAWESGERQGTLEARDAEEQRKKDMAEYVQQQMANPEIPQKNKSTAMFFMKAGEYEKAYQALQPAQPDYMSVPEGGQIFDQQSGKFSAVPGGGAGKPTDDLREYERAKQEGFQGTFMDYMRAMKEAGAMKINLGPNGENFGEPGPGLVWQRDPSTRQIMLDEQGLPIAMPFKGGKAFEENEAKKKADEFNRKAQGQTGSIVIEDIDRALKIIEDSPGLSTGIGGQMTSGIGGSPGHNLVALTATIRANTGFDKLQAMRDSSPTGGALGQITERELAFLQAAIGNLENSQNSEQLKFNLKRVRQIYSELVHGVGDAQEPGAEDQSLDDLLKKYGG